MNRKHFYDEINIYIKSLEKEELIHFINNIIRKIPDNKINETMCIINNSTQNKDEIKKKIYEYKDFFRKVDDNDLMFYAEQYDDYTYGWQDWKEEYTDKDGISETINESIQYLVNLVNLKEYNFAKELLDLILNTDYEAYDENSEEFYELSLIDLYSEKFISVHPSLLCSYMIYILFFVSKDRVKQIYNYFKNDYNFHNIVIQDSFNLGIEEISDLNIFFEEWIDFLVTIKGDIEYRLLKEAFEYTEYANYKNYMDKIAINHPKIYIDIFEFLKGKNRVDELIDIGKKSLNLINTSEETGSDIALYLSNIDMVNKEEYIYKAFLFSPSVLNLLRMINNNYFKKYEKSIKNRIDEINIAEKKDTFDLIQFFIGNFEYFYEESIKHQATLGWTGSFQKTSVYLWLLLLNNNDEKSKSYLKLLNNVFNDMGYCETEAQMLGDDTYKIWIKWKNNFVVDGAIRTKVVEWLDKLIENRIDAIMNGNFRNAYDRAALLVVAYDEMMASQKLISKGEYIKCFTNKYSRRSSFKREINELQ